MVPSVIVIARSEQAAGLRKRLGNESGVALYSDSESLKALEAILAGPPKILALDRSFVATARAAALVARVKSEPSLRATDVRVLAEDEMHLPVLFNSRMPGFEGALVRASYPLDYCGTRRAPRFATSGGVNVVVNGKGGQLVNVSCIGAQVAAVLRLRPEEPVRLSLADQKGEVKLQAVVAWSVVEPADGQICYRAGVEFIEPDSMTLEGFCSRNIAGPDRTSSAA
jgi:PilZ domain